jgi:hypothetical protein
MVFNPDFDTCSGCGGQMTPSWKGYGEHGPSNGNCAGELDECDTNVIFTKMYLLDTDDPIITAHDWDLGECIKWINIVRSQFHKENGYEPDIDELLEYKWELGE